ncbi:MAG: oligosaccharide flippase family protein [Prevotellaceae bacterium]|nr:oligosaccharide flippase family protein [Prevotellaceae bacterium]
MPQNISTDNQRIAKNTLFLYFRTILVMAISLYTSRVVLATLGVEDFGIYNVVGGVVAMFGMISGALSSAISRFITFEIGRGNVDKLKRIFSTSVNIQLGIALVIILLGETVGLWFLNSQMNIPADRMYAANWVLHCSLLTFAINLISTPYNAAIIAHERMSVFAYISILEVTLKLVVVYLLYISLWDKLIIYSLLLVAVAVCIRLVYGIYCTRHFEETKYTPVHDNQLVKEMSSFAGWSFLTNTASLFNTQGINILINLFFGVGVNAARGIAIQVEHALMQFVNNFTTALTPQITKSYASGNISAMNRLVIRGAKFSFFLSLLICLPVIMEADFILELWLTEVPKHTADFVRLAIIATMVDRLGNTGYTACMATGNIRKYVLWITSVGCLVFPLTYLVYKMGAVVETAYIIYILVYIGVTSVRLWIMKGLLNFPVWEFVREVVFKILLVSAVSVVLPSVILYLMPQSLMRLIISVIIALLSVSVCTYLFGLAKNERNKLTAKMLYIINHKLRKH